MPAPISTNEDAFVPNSDADIKNLITAMKSLMPKDGAGGSYDRAKLRQTASRLSLALETPGDTVQRVAYLPLQTTVVRIANKLDIFYILGKHNAAMTGKDLAQIVNADSVLLIRLLRYLAAMGAIKETGVDSYMANNITLNLTVLALKAGLNHTYDIVDTAGMALPAFLAKTNYRNPIDPKYCPFTEAYSTPEGLFEWFPKHPEYLHNFNLWMTGQRDGRVSWLDFFPFEQQLSKDFQGGDKAVMLVDIGGAFGHEVAAIKAKYPRLPGRFILQDLPDTVKQAIEVPGMEAMAHDFFTPQPIKGARTYYFRNILHDWPNNKCIEILSQTASAMEKGYSKILVNEFVMPDRDASLIATQVDITMMVALAGSERTESQLKELVEAVGLKIMKIWGDDPDAERILELELK